MSQRVTLDHPDLGGRVRQNTSSIKQPTKRVKHVDSMMARRAQHARARTTRTTHAKPEVNPHDTEFLNKATAAAQARVRDLESTKAYSDSYNSIKGTTASKWKINSIYAMSTLLFVIGMFVALNGFISTTKANEQIDAIDKVLGSGDRVAVSALADSLPNEDDVSDVDISAYQVGPNDPRYIRIPSIGVRTTRVLNTGLTDDNAVDTPEGIYDTSWYNRSAKLNDELGAMFIVGHYVGPNKAGVFFNLEDVKVGNIVEVEDGDGDLSHFRIVEKHSFPVDSVDMDLALNPVNPDKLGLNLMTCGGEWSVSSQQYDHRTLVRTERI